LQQLAERRARSVSVTAPDALFFVAVTGWWEVGSINVMFVCFGCGQGEVDLSSIDMGDSKLFPEAKTVGFAGTSNVEKVPYRYP